MQTQRNLGSPFPPPVPRTETVGLDCLPSSPEVLSHALATIAYADATRPAPVAASLQPHAMRARPAFWGRML